MDNLLVSLPTRVNPSFSFLKLKYGNAKNTLGRLDREIVEYISAKIGEIEGAKPIRNHPDPKIIVRIHEINGGGTFLS
jgi:hypothetical protein